MEAIAPGNTLDMLGGPEYIEYREWGQTLRYINDNGGVYDGTTIGERSNKYHLEGGILIQMILQTQIGRRQ